ncbi:TPA: MFS transporter [Pseudomonas aeruginosa]|nr:MFS transporter [Pseudomonas aeruginosa]
MGALMAPVAGVLSDRFSAAVMGGVGMALLAGGIAGVAALPADVTRGAVMLFMACCGVGFGLFLSPNQRTLMASAPTSRGGSASGVLGISRVLGQAIGATFVALALSISTQAGAGAVLWVGMGFAVLSCGLSLSRLVTTT